VWKSFLGGLSNGTASSSAVAFAEGSYKASQAGMALSGQIAAGTASVNNLATMGTVGEAVNAGVGMAQSAFSSGSDPQTSWSILFNGLNDATAPAADAAQASGAGILSTQQTSTLESELYNSDLYMADNTVRDPGQLSTDVSSAADTPGYGPSVGENPVTAPYTPPTEVASIAKPAVTPTSPMFQMFLAGQEQARLDRLDYNAQILAQNAERARIDNMKLGMTGAGLFLNAFGQYSQAKAAEEDRKPKFEWKKPTGNEYDPYKGLIA
jgi:hypothetical protein